MQKIIMMRGLPGSGKSSWVKAFIKEHPEFIRVNKDDIRAMIGYTTYNKKKETYTVDCEYRCAEKAVYAGYSVIVDDTNYNPFHEKKYRKLAEKYGTEFEIHEMDTPLDVCIERDALRENPVGEEVIRNMAQKWSVINTEEAKEGIHNREKREETFSVKIRRLMDESVRRSR